MNKLFYIVSLFFMATAQASYLSDQDIETFYNQGYVVVREAFPAEEIQEMSGLIKEITERIQSEFSQGDFETGKEFREYLDGSQVVFKKTENGISILRVVGCGPFYEILCSEKMANSFFNLLRCNELEHLICQLHPKEPKDEVSFPAHRDINHRRAFDPAWQDTTGHGSYAISILAIDPMSEENGGLWIDNSDFSISVQGDTSIPDEADQHRQFLQMNPGDLLFMHPHLLHGSGPNTSNRSRHTLLSGFCVYGANHENYPGNCTNRVLKKAESGEIEARDAPWKRDNDPRFISH